MPKILGVLALIAIAFGVGWYPQSQQVASLTGTLEQEREATKALLMKLKNAEVRDDGALLYLEVVRQNFVEASGIATRFFNGVRDLSAQSTDAAEKARLMEILDQRDGITANLALANPMLPSQLQKILLQLHGLPTQ